MAWPKSLPAPPLATPPTSSFTTPTAPGSNPGPPSPPPSPAAYTWGDPAVADFRLRRELLIPSVHAPTSEVMPAPAESRAPAYFRETDRPAGDRKRDRANQRRSAAVGPNRR